MTEDDLALLAVTGRDYETPAVFRTVRVALGYTQSELGLLMGYGRRGGAYSARGAYRTISTYERAGAPVTAALALRYLAIEHGLIGMPAIRAIQKLRREA